MASLAALAVMAVTVVVFLTASASFGMKASTLYSLDNNEMKIDNDFALKSILNPGQSAKKYGKIAQAEMLAAKKYDNLIKSSEDEASQAKEIAHLDQAQLQGLYSGTFSSGDPLGLHTGNLANYDTLDSLVNLPKTYSSTTPQDASGLSAMTTTQLSGLKSELNSLNSKKQDILSALKLQQQSTAAKMAKDALYADSVRLNRAQATSSARQIRAAMRTAQIAEQRAREARVIEQNQNAIAQYELKRMADLTAQGKTAWNRAAQAESQMRASEAVKRAAKDRDYNSAMQYYTSSLQDNLSDDMSTLNRLKSAEEAAAPGPRLVSGTWQKPPLSSNLPEVDPALFMNDAPFRTIDALTSPSYKQTGTSQLTQTAGLTQLSQTSSKYTRQAPKQQNHQESSIFRVMQQADQELAALDQEKKVKSSANNAQDKALHSQIDSNLRSLLKQAKKTGVDISSVDQDFKAPATSSSTATDVSQDSSLLSNNQHFTSFPKASLASVQQAKGDATLLDDGALIKNPNAPVARIAIPLGAHQDAKEDRKLGRTWKTLRRAPKATIVDDSTEASAVRADGSHNTMEKLRMPQGRITSFNKLPVSVHMPHLQ